MQQIFVDCGLSYITAHTTEPSGKLQTWSQDKNATAALHRLVHLCPVNSRELLKVINSGVLGCAVHICRIPHYAISVKRIAGKKLNIVEETQRLDV